MFNRYRVAVGTAICRASLIRFAALLALVWAASAAEQKPAFTIQSDHPDGRYKIGEPVGWELKGDLSRFQEASYTLKKGGMTTILEGRAPLADLAGKLETSLDAPGSLLLEVKAKDADGRTARALGGVLVSPEQIQPASPRPDDFDNFWRAKLDELAKIPANPQLEKADCGKQGVDYWKITMDNIRGTHIRGQVARPATGEKFPAMLIVQWAGVYPLQKAWVTDPASAGWLVLNINAHDLPIDEPADFYQKQSEGPLKDYPGIGNDNRETSYFLRMYLSCYRAAQYLTERPDWNGKTLLVTGGSQGGLQTLMTAGLHPAITAAIASVPAGCDLTGPTVGRSPGWPMWWWKTEGKDAAKVREASRYYDVVNFASQIKCPVLAGVGLVDETCPPAGIMAALNQSKAPKEIVLLPGAGHANLNNSHGPFEARSRAWKQALLEGKAAPVR